MKKEKSLLLLMAAASVGAVHATPPAFSASVLLSSYSDSSGNIDFT